MLRKNLKSIAYSILFLSILSIASCKTMRETEADLHSTTSTPNRVAPVLGLSMSVDYLTLLDRFPFSIGNQISYPLGRLGLRVEGKSNTNIVSRIRSVPNNNFAELQIYSAIRQRADYEINSPKASSLPNIIDATTANQVSSVINILFSHDGVRLSGPTPLNPKVASQYQSNLPPLFFKGIAETSFRQELPAIEAHVQKEVWNQFDQSVKSALPNVEGMINQSWQKNILTPLFHDQKHLRIGQNLRFSTNVNQLNIELNDFTLAREPQPIQLPYANVQMKIHPDFFNNFFARYLKPGRMSSKELSDLFTRLPLIDSFLPKGKVYETEDSKNMGIKLIGDRPIVAEVQNGALVFFMRASFYKNDYETKAVDLAIPYYPKELSVKGYWSIQIGDIQLADLYGEPEAKSKWQKISNAWRNAGEEIAIKTALRQAFPNDLIMRNITVLKDDERRSLGWYFTARDVKTDEGWVQAAWGLEYGLIFD